MVLGKTERARTLVNLDVGSDWGNYLTATMLVREGKLAEAEAREAAELYTSLIPAAENACFRVAPRPARNENCESRIWL